MLSQPNEPPDEMVSEIRARLGRMCESCAADEFNLLVRQIAVVRDSYDAMRAETFFGAARFLAAERIAAQSLTDDVISRSTQT
jgi:hypothetical protein